MNIPTIQGLSSKIEESFPEINGDAVAKIAIDYFKEIKNEQRSFVNNESLGILTQSELLKYPNYLLSTYQLQFYSLLHLYMKDNGIKKQKDVAVKLGLSDASVYKILRGECNLSLEKIIELGLKLGKVAYLEFVSPDEYFKREI